MTSAKLIVKADFKRRMYQVRDDIEMGRLTFHNTPEWTDKLLNITALNLTMLMLAEEARWN